MVTIRAATADDLAACRAVWLATEGYNAPPGAETLPLHGHELQRGRLLVAVSESEDSDVVGFGATFTRSGVAYLADLFVDPAHQGQGIGGALLRALFADHDGPRFTMASGSAAARKLYERHGMAPAWPLSYLLGDIDAIDTTELVDASVRARRVDLDAVLAVDLEVTRR